MAWATATSAPPQTQRLCIGGSCAAPLGVIVREKGSTTISRRVMDRESIQERFGIIGTSPGLRGAVDRARQVARTDITVLIEGESGVGKELIAEAVHALSDRRHEAMLVVNCGAIPEGLIESELFGAEKGAYTGAMERRSGYFEEADGGTIFLDEIGEMPAAAQVRLLRVLESGQFSRVGSSAMRQTDTRILAATNKNLGREVEAGRFREDLYYRLSTVIIQVPPLRERRADILPIFESFLHRFGQQYNSPRKRLTGEAEELITQYRWPGNVRELRNVAEQVVVLLRGEAVEASDLRPLLRGVTAGGPQSSLMRLPREEAPPPPSDASGRELLYRAILELRHEMSALRRDVGEVKEQLRRPGVVVPRAFIEQGEGAGSAGEHAPAERALGEYVIMREGDNEDDGHDYDSLIEDVTYEIEDEEEAQREDRRPASNGLELGAALPDAREEVREETPANELPDGADDPIPTLEETERALIRRALRRFDGNRRETARTLGISERTLYRKLKDMDEDL